MQAAYQYENVAFYTQANPSSYALEGTAFYAYTAEADGTIPVYRSFNSSEGDHLFTASSSEKDATGYSYEGIAFYAYAAQADGTVPVYRFYNSSTVDHFYTTSDAEKNALINNPQWGYAYEGVAFYVYADQADGTSAVYRFYNASTGDHFYTASEDEKNSISLSPIYRFLNPATGNHFFTASEFEKSIIANTSKSGYLFEGIAFYAFTTDVSGSTPVYRSYNSTTGDHFYTTSDSERNADGYSYEGIAFYAFASQVSGTSPVYRFYDPSSGDHFYTISENEKSRLQISELGPEISVGLWAYTKSDLQSDYFNIDANKSYNIKDKNGNIITAIEGGTETKVSYDSSGYLWVSGSVDGQKVKTTVNFDAADGDNTDLIFNVHRPSSDYDEYREK